TLPASHAWFRGSVTKSHTPFLQPAWPKAKTKTSDAKCRPKSNSGCDVNASFHPHRTDSRFGGGNAAGTRLRKGRARLRQVSRETRRRARAWGVSDCGFGRATRARDAGVARRHTR